MTPGQLERERPSAPAPSDDTSDVAVRWLELGELWPRRGAPQVREELVRRFLPLARRLAFRYRNFNEPMEDLVQVACLGLLGAIDRFDPLRGGTFHSFAVPTILGELKRSFRNTGWAAHVPRGAKEMALRVDQASGELTAQTGRPPDVQALADHLGVGPRDVLVGLDARTAHYSASLDAPAPEGDSENLSSLADTLGEDDDLIGLTETLLSLRVAISALPYLERRALTLRTAHDLKQTDIARRMGCSQMQVSRLLGRATTKVRAQIDPALHLADGASSIEPRLIQPGGS